MSNKPFPETVVEILDDHACYSPEILLAVQKLADSGPWTGSVASRKEKFRRCNQALSVACGTPVPKLEFGRLEGGSSGASHYIPRHHRIVMVGKLSVVTFLHEFAHALGYGERKACRWSINLFRKCFPRQYSNLIHVGHTLVRPQDISTARKMDNVR